MIPYERSIHEVNNQSNRFFFIVAWPRLQRFYYSPHPIRHQLERAELLARITARMHNANHRHRSIVESLQM